MSLFINRSEFLSCEKRAECCFTLSTCCLSKHSDVIWVQLLCCLSSLMANHPHHSPAHPSSYLISIYQDGRSFTLLHTSSLSHLHPVTATVKSVWVCQCETSLSTSTISTRNTVDGKKDEARMFKDIKTKLEWRWVERIPPPKPNSLL